MKKNTQNQNLKSRPPIVVVLGHVDHGKTTLLDYIRKTNVAEKESGGITQHIGAYQIEHNHKKITFIDTPGHQAFSQMRSRGARVADIAIVVIAVEEGIKPQTQEVISYIKKYEIPTIIALNKIDKPVANTEKVINQLSEQEIMLESRGGDVPSVNISAKTGQGVDELLEVLLLLAEMEELKADPNQPGSGVVVESYLDNKRGPTATFLVKNGTLKKGDSITCGASYGKVKELEDFKSQSMDQAGPSMPGLVLGLNQVPAVGDQFIVVKSEQKAQQESKKYYHQQKVKEKASISNIQGKKIINIILKADAKGSLEAIKQTIDNVDQQEVVINIVDTKIGDVSESDIKLARSTNSIIFGFRIKVSDFIFNLAKRQNIKIRTFDVIYELIKGIKKELSKLLEPETIKERLGRMKVLVIFKKQKSRMIIGGKVISGKVENKAKASVIRNKQKIGEGKIVQLQQDKKDVPEVGKGKEAGIMFEGDPVIEEGDVLDTYMERKENREL